MQKEMAALPTADCSGTGAVGNLRKLHRASHTLRAKTAPWKDSAVFPKLAVNSVDLKIANKRHAISLK
jgi:hypothetical protein